MEQIPQVESTKEKLDRLIEKAKTMYDPSMHPEIEDSVNKMTVEEVTAFIERMEKENGEDNDQQIAA